MSVLIRLGVVLVCAMALSGCIVTQAAKGAVEVTGAVVGTTIGVAGDAAEAVIDVATPDDDDDEDEDN